MGYSISQETYETIQKRRREGRLCSMDREHTARAVWKVQERYWPYTEDRLAGKPGKDSTAVYCDRHFTRFIRPWLGNTTDPQLANCIFLSAERF